LKIRTNDIGSVYNVTGITIAKQKIAHRLEKVYLSANSNYANARTYGIQSAADLYEPSEVYYYKRILCTGEQHMLEQLTLQHLPAPTNLAASNHCQIYSDCRNRQC
jgi:Tfp pilus assembly protein PilE